MKGCSMLFPTGVAGRDKEACTAESILSMSKVGELGADIRSVVRSRTASSCLRSAEDSVRLRKYSSANLYTGDTLPAKGQNGCFCALSLPRASSFSRCTDTRRDSFSSSSLSRKAFLSMAWFKRPSKSSRDTIVALHIEEHNC